MEGRYSSKGRGTGKKKKIKEENADSNFRTDSEYSRIQTRIINKRKWTVGKDKDKDKEGN